MTDPRLPMTVEVEWWDGKTETFEVYGLIIGRHSLDLELTSGAGRHIPLRNVRWYDYRRSDHPGADVA